MRLNDVCYMAGWSWLNYWPNLLDGMDHDHHAWAQANHSDRRDGIDGWNSEVIRFAQASFHPYLLIDRQIEKMNPHYEANWPRIVPTYGLDDTIERDIEVFNGGLTGEKMNLKWECRWDTPTGKTVFSGSTGDFTVTLGSHVTKHITFTAPPPTQTTRPLFIVLTALKDGVVVNSESRIHIMISNRKIIPTVGHFLRIDRDTRGDWRKRYGTDGYVLYGKNDKKPLYASLDINGTDDNAVINGVFFGENNSHE